MDTPRCVCISCERLCYKRSVAKVNIDGSERKIPVLDDLMIYLTKENIDPQYICYYCKEKLYQGLMPAYCILNNLQVNNVPEAILSLNTFEKILIQRAKAFQTIVKMGTVFNKKLPERQMIQKVKGRTFHLPLPLQETLNKLCFDTDAINTDHELYILVRGIPTKSKIIWEEIVDIKKIFDALTWLKCNNPLYSRIVLPNIYNELSFKALNNPEFQIEEIENAAKNKLDEDLQDENASLHNSKSEIQEIKNVAFEQHEAMLTQVINHENDDYYEQYTIYPLYEKKIKLRRLCINVKSS